MSVEPKKWGVIYNPKAGTRKVKKRWKEIKEYMDSKGVDYDYVQSEGFGSVERLAKILANNGYRTIVIVGGDGALNDAINGIMLSDAEDKENIALGMIPNGIGNDFAKYWGLSTEYKPAVDCIINHRLKKIDVGYCNFYDGNEHQRRYFLNAVNIGLGARIVKITDQTKRFWGVKFLSYVAALFSLIFERKLYRMHLRINDEHIRGRVLTDELLIYYFSINTPACSTIAVYLKNLSPHGNFRIINIFLKEEMGNPPSLDLSISRLII